MLFRSKKVITCLHCSLVQFVAGARCRRCKKVLCLMSGSKKPMQLCLALTPSVAGVSVLPWPERLPTLAEAEADLLQEAIRRSAGNLLAAARLVGIGRTTIYRKFRKAS